MLLLILRRMGNVPDRWSRRLLRIAVHSRDVARLRQLTNRGIDVNMVISDVFCDTALTYAVKYGYLEIVEILVKIPGCRLDQLDRNNHSALDEAVRTWLASAVPSAEVRSRLSSRFRIIRCLLEAGASHISANFLDMVVFSTLSTQSGFEFLAKLVHLFCKRGCSHVKSTLLSIVIFYQRTASMVGLLLVSAALPMYYVRKNPAQLTIPFDNALLIIRTCAQREILRRVDADTSSSLEMIEKHWSEYRKIVRVFTLSGYPLQMFVVNYLFRCHADVLRWVIRYNNSPRPLQHLTRNVIRRQMEANVGFALSSIRYIPESLKLFLLFSDV